MNTDFEIYKKNVVDARFYHQLDALAIDWLKNTVNDQYGSSEAGILCNSLLNVLAALVVGPYQIVKKTEN